MQGRQEVDAEQQEDEAHFVVLPRQVLELQREHRNLRYQQPREEADQCQQSERMNTAAGQYRMVARYERGPEQRVGRHRQTDERSRLARIVVKLRQAQGREYGDEESRVGKPGRHAFHIGGVGHLLKQGEDDERRCHAEADVVGQRIQIFADRGMCIQRTCGQSVEKVEHGTDDDKQQRQFVAAFEGHHAGDAARKQVQAGQCVRNMSGDAVSHNLDIILVWQ